MERMTRRQAMAEGKIERLPYVNSKITATEMNKAKDLVQEAAERFYTMYDLVALYSMKNARTKNERIAVAAVLSTANEQYGLDLDQAQYLIPPTSLCYQQVEQAEKNLKEGYVNMAFWSNDECDAEVVKVSFVKLRYMVAKYSMQIQCFANGIKNRKPRKHIVFFRRRYVLR